MKQNKKRIRTGITTYEGGFFAKILGRHEVCNKHKKIWREGDLYEENGGKACKECIEKARSTKYKRK